MLTFFSSLVLAQSSANPSGADPKSVLAAIVSINAEVPSNARTAKTLGTQRSGSGVIIDSDGLILTIGYLILEALTVELTLANDQSVPAQIVAYDHNSGFGLLRATRPLPNQPIQLGDSKALQSDEPILIISRDPKEAITPAQVIVRKVFAGAWEYLVDSAIFTSPPHRNFSGAALINNRGELLGIGSLILNDILAHQPNAEAMPGNMFVPVDLIQPVLPELLKQGRPAKARPWLGLYAGEYRKRLFIDRVSEESPAAQAGLTENDLIVAVAHQPVSTLSGFLRHVWALGEAGVIVPITVLRDMQLVDIQINSGNRYDWLRLNPSL